MVNDKSLTAESIASLLKKIPDWKSITLNNVMQLERQFQFKGFQDALAFTNNVAKLAENENHHPMLITEWGKVTVRWWTHTAQGIKEKDFICAIKTNEIYNKNLYKVETMQQDDLELANPFSEDALIWIRYLCGKLGAGYSFPFGDDTMVFKVSHKVFALLAVDEKTKNLRINLKCDPDRALELRDVFSCVIPGHHMNKRHWNTVILNGELPQSEIENQIDHSYELVVNGLNDKQREVLLKTAGK